MPATKKKTTRTRRKTTGRKKARPRSARKTTSVRRPARPKSPQKKSLPHTAKGVTLVYECTEPGCGYRIWREEKDETGHLRFDLKCPKCHRKVFRCLGQGDVPESFETPPPPAQLDFDSMKTAELGSN